MLRAADLKASTNYVGLGETGFVRGVPARAIDYPDTQTALATVEQLWSELA